MRGIVLHRPIISTVHRSGKGALRTGIPGLLPQHYKDNVSRSGCQAVLKGTSVHYSSGEVLMMEECLRVALLAAREAGNSTMQRLCMTTCRGSP